MFVLLFALLCARLHCALASTIELDADTLWKRVSADTQTDLLVYFHPAAQRRAAHALAHGLARRMHLAEGPSTVLGLYDLTLHGGFPSGIHVHAHGDEGAILLFPAGGREPQAYDWTHDPLSEWPRGRAAAAGVQPDGSSSSSGGGGDGHGDDDHGAHAHALAPSGNGVLRFLKKHSSFPSDIPVVALSDLWEGREDDLFTAVATGLDALHKRMEALQAENARLAAELAACARA